ncbi:MAG TPA: efflux transporter outer membrane subunit [Syntrophorhabdaceae bacterium]|jgi:multidrug efflux system outer membrane protein
MRKFVLMVMCIVLLGGCAMGPDYRRPSVDVPSAWRLDEKDARDLVDTLWWEQFNDPVLDDLITTALKQNYDLKIAAARVEEFVGHYWVTRSGLFPQIGATGQGGRQRTTQNSSMGVTPFNPSTMYQAGFTGSWEIDIWGRLRRATEAARANILSTEEARQGVVLTLVSNVANGYVNLRDLDKQLEIAERTAASRRESLRLFTLQFQNGLISRLQLAQVKSEYEQAMATIPALRKQITFQENGISVLLGNNPGPIARGKSVDDLILPEVPSGLPSDLLTRRPDIRQAEQGLIASNALIGAARALYFPTISLTGLLGWQSTQLSNLFSGSSQTWNWAGTFTAPIFTGGNITGQVMVSEAQQQQALFQYRKTIQNAFQDVNDSLEDQKQTKEQLIVLGRQVDALKDYARTARRRYDNGYTSYIEVLDAERSLFNAELQYAQTQGTLFQALVNLYKAMGGGWVAKGSLMTAPDASGY